MGSDLRRNDDKGRAGARQAAAFGFLRQTCLRRVMPFIAAAALAAGWVVPAAAQDFKKLTGEYVFTTDAASKSKELGLIITGPAAQELYAAMPFKAKADPCTGGLQKGAPNGMFCLKDNKEFTCSMGIVVKTRKVTAGPLTC